MISQIPRRVQYCNDHTGLVHLAHPVCLTVRPVADSAPRTITNKEELNRHCCTRTARQTGFTRFTGPCGRYSISITLLFHQVRHSMTRILSSRITYAKCLPPHYLTTLIIRLTSKQTESFRCLVDCAITKTMPSKIENLVGLVTDYGETTHPKVQRVCARSFRPTQMTGPPQRFKRESRTTSFC